VIIIALSVGLMLTASVITIAHAVVRSGGPQ